MQICTRATILKPPFLTSLHGVYTFVFKNFFLYKKGKQYLIKSVNHRFQEKLKKQQFIDSDVI